MEPCINLKGNFVFREKPKWADYIESKTTGTAVR